MTCLECHEKCGSCVTTNNCKKCILYLALFEIFSPWVAQVKQSKKAKGGFVYLLLYPVFIISFAHIDPRSTDFKKEQAKLNSIWFCRNQHFMNCWLHEIFLIIVWDWLHYLVFIKSNNLLCGCIMLVAFPYPFFFHLHFELIVEIFGQFN